MKLESEEIYHVYNRGNNRERLFYDVENYPYFLAKLEHYLSPHCDMLAYCLMPNHFHLLIYANRRTNIIYRRMIGRSARKRPGFPVMTRFSKGLQLLLSSYAKAINKRYLRTGSLFRQNTKSRKTSDDLYAHDYSLVCFNYIHNNPVSAGLVRAPEDWEFSSYRDYAGLSSTPSICNLELGRKLLCLDQNEIMNQKVVDIPDHILRKIFK